MDLGDVQTAEAPSSSSPPPPPRAVRSRPSSWSSSASSGGSVEYTSLRDVLSEMQGAGGSGSSFGDVHDIDTANINIRNHLLKHAASAYLQSAIVVTPRDRGCLSRCWRRMLPRRRCLILRPPWAWPRPGCECAADDGPVHRCAAALAGSARRLLACLSGCVTCMCT